MKSPNRPPLRTHLHTVADQAADYLESLETRHACRQLAPEDLLRSLESSLPEEGTPAETVIRELVDGVEPGLVASSGPRFLGFVMGGATPASLMADWLTSTWDQNAQVFATSPAAAVVEEIVSRWLLELLGLPASCSVGLVTGCQMANFTALACARGAVLERAGWDQDTQGLFGAPPVVVFLSECGHGTVRSALRMLGIGSAQIREIPSDEQGRLRLPELEKQVRKAAGQPMIISLQAGNVNTGAFEPVDSVAELVQEENAWIHVDGAFGLWAATSPELGESLQGFTRADSWATDAHKWLNVPYDSGIVVVQDAVRHRELKAARCAYAGEEASDRRDGSTWVPENSRRARAFVLYAVLRELGRSGVRAMVERCCRLAREFARAVEQMPGGRVLNDVVLNQVLIGFKTPPGVDSDQFHRALAAEVQAEGKCWLGTTAWKGRLVMRASISNWSTTDQDIHLALESLARARQQIAARQGSGT